MSTRKVTFEWSTEYGECHDCGLPAAFASGWQAIVNAGTVKVIPATLKRCAVCAANDAAAGEHVIRIDQLA